MCLQSRVKCKIRIMKINLQDLREEYSEGVLDISSVEKNPFHQFEIWFHQALEAQTPEPNAMTLATVTPEGRPSARVVLLKGFDEKGLVFYTNYQSRKGKELEATPFATLVFLWLPLQRQVRIEGQVARVPADESTEYFQSRPRDSQIGAWASPQSTVIDGREVLEESVKELQEKYGGNGTLPRPPQWGGYRVKPYQIEFWQGRPSRLHDRIQYTRQVDGRWKIERLAP